ncbi:MAG TPA: hypothetical protein VJ482_02285 [Acidimicrobiia bacterium]|nr:hypothetical protein [Acidimicrobiia bacterium]
MRRFGILVLAFALLAAACNRNDDTELTTTTTTGSQTTTTTAGPATGGGTDDETTTTAGTAGVPQYDIIAGDSGSGEYVVLIEPDTHTELDLRNIMEAIVDEYAPVTVHLIDNETAGELVLKDQPSAAEQAVLDAHYFARVVNGTTLEFLGPYAHLESVHIGS